MMRKSNIFLFVVVFIMFTPLLKAFGMASSPKNVMGATRNVNLSGNVFSFAMPESFSNDMPADPLVENVDIENSRNERIPVLLQRWWDVKESGFFGKDLGSVMMSVNVYPVPKNSRKEIHDSPYNPQDRLDLILIIDELIHARYEGETDINDEFSYFLPNIAYLLGERLSTGYRDNIYGSQKWTSYSVAGPRSQLIVNSVLPINERVLLEASFIFSPNDGVLPRHFLDHAYKITDPIHESFFLEYKNDNPLKVVVEQKWIDGTTSGALQVRKLDNILSLFGPKVHQTFLLGRDESHE